MSGEQAIRDLIATWLRASEAGDFTTVLGLIADDALFIVPGRPPFGKAEFAAASEGMKAVKMTGKSDIQEIEVSGGMAWCRTHLSIAVTPPNGQTMRRSGYTLSIFRRKPDGAWMLVRDANLLTAE